MVHDEFHGTVRDHLHSVTEDGSLSYIHPVGDAPHIREESLLVGVYGSVVDEDMVAVDEIEYYDGSFISRRCNLAKQRNAFLPAPAAPNYISVEHDCILGTAKTDVKEQVALVVPKIEASVVDPTRGVWCLVIANRPEGNDSIACDVTALDKNTFPDVKGVAGRHGGVLQ